MRLPACSARSQSPGSWTSRSTANASCIPAMGEALLLEKACGAPPSLLDDALRADRAPRPRMELLLRRPGAAADVELDRAEGPFVALDRHAQGGQQPLGRVEVH